MGLEETVIARELLGAEVVLYFQAQGRNQAVRLKPENETKRGESISFYFDTEKLYAFDMDTQENLFYKEDLLMNKKKKAVYPLMDIYCRVC